jgi:hypothetical protein
MHKASKPGSAKRPAQKKPAPKQASTKPAKPRKAQGGAGLAEVVAQLARSAERLAQAADRLTDATTRLSVAAEAWHENIQTRSRPAAEAVQQQESEVADATDGE